MADWTGTSTTPRVNAYKQDGRYYVRTYSTEGTANTSRQTGAKGFGTREAAIAYGTKRVKIEDAQRAEVRAARASMGVA